MAEETKVAEVPAEIAKPSESEPLIDNRRAQIENLVIAENERIPEVVVDEPAPVVETPKEEVKPADIDADPVQRIKDTVQKRIDKVIAQKKSVEERLAEAEAELSRLKNAPTTPEKPIQPGDTPTPEQVEAYIAKMSEEGNHREVAAATRYLIKLEKELALKEVEERQTATQREQEAQKARQLAQWTDLNRDYVAYTADGAPDPKSDLTLANQNGLLYKTALSLYNDKELHKDFYNDADVLNGFRRAVADAYREITQQGLHKTPKGEEVPVPRTPRVQLADPSADTVEDAPPNTSNSLSDAEKVREEIRARKKNRYTR